MLAHKIRVLISADHEVRFKAPLDCPSGEAEVILLTQRQRPALSLSSTPAEPDLTARLLAKYPAAGTLGPVRFLEDPTAPLDEEDWPSELMP